MKALALRLSAIGVMVISLVLWIYGGGQVGFYKEYYEVMEFDPILELSYPVKVDAFLPGIETLAIGFAAFVALSVLSAILERKKTSSHS